MRAVLRIGMLWFCGLISVTVEALDVAITSGNSHHDDVCWSPDSGWVAYSGLDAAGYGQIYKLDARGGEPVAITDGSHSHLRPEWSPDGRWIAFVRDDDTGMNRICKVSVTGGDEDVLTEDTGLPYWMAGDRYEPFWSPDSKWLTYWMWLAACTGRVYKVSIEDRDEIPLTEEVHTYTSMRPRWSPDGSWIAYCRADFFDPGNPGEFWHNIHRVRIDGTGDVCLTTGGDHESPEWSPDGKWIGFLTWDVGLPCRSIAKMQVTGGAEEFITTDRRMRSPSGFEWSNDGRWLVSDGEDPAGIWQIYRVSANAGQEVALTCGEDDHDNPSVSPDVKWIAYEKTDALGYRQIYKLGPIENPGVGWLEGIAEMPIAGCEIVCDQSTGGIGGISAGGVTGQTMYLGHFASNNAWYTGIVIANPGAVETTAQARFYGDDGSLVGERSFTIPAKGKVSTLLSKIGVSGTGWAEVSSSVPVLSSEVFGALSGGEVGALESQAGSGDGIVVPHFAENKAWSTWLGIVNPGESAITVDAYAYAKDGELLGQVAREVQARSKWSGNVCQLFPMLTWPVEGWVLAVPRGGSIFGVAVYRSSIEQDLAIVPAAPSAGLSRLCFPRVVSDRDWWTGMVLTNPTETEAAVSVKAYDKKGNALTPRSSCPAVIGPKQKAMGLASAWFEFESSSSAVEEGWIEVTATGAPIVGLELLGGGDGAIHGLAGLTGVEPSNVIYYPHYRVGSRWTTLMAVANPGDSNGNVEANVHQEDGSDGETIYFDRPSKGSVADLLDRILVFAQ